MSDLNEYNKTVIEEFRTNQGKVSGQMENMPVMLITMTGNKTGRTITKPLVYSKDRGRMVVIASFAGAPKHPAWYLNLVANPEVTVEVGIEKFRAKVEDTRGDERKRLFDAQATQMSVFNDYQKKTDRQIPVLTLTRID